MTFSQKLKYILSEQNISQAELSRLTGINKSSICQYLSGKNIPSKKRQGVIATAIGMPEDYFGNENFKEPSMYLQLSLQVLVLHNAPSSSRNSQLQIAPRP